MVRKTANEGKIAEQGKEELPRVQHSSTTTLTATVASATPPGPLSVSQMMGQLGNYETPVMNHITEFVNHLFHHASVLEATLDRQSRSLLSVQPPTALTVFNDGTTFVKGLRANISQFATTFGLEDDKLILQPQHLPLPKKSIFDYSKFGSKKMKRKQPELLLLSRLITQQRISTFSISQFSSNQ